MRYQLLLAAIPLFAILSAPRLAAQSPSGAIPSSSGMNTSSSKETTPAVDSSNATSDAVPAPDEFVLPDVDPGYDPDELMSKLVYPEEAKKNNIQGTVIIRILVDKEGFARKTIVDRSDDPLLEEAALNAVYSITFTPAMQKGKPIAVWVQIPINFTLN